MTRCYSKKTQINKIKDEIVNITTNTNKTQRIIREYFENLYSGKMENQKVMDKFLHVYSQPKMSHEGISYLNTSITGNEIEAVINSPYREELRN
jgi:hypothetical protein